MARGGATRQGGNKASPRRSLSPSDGERALIAECSKRKKAVRARPVA
jgi:hypothetical protein